MILRSSNKDLCDSLWDSVDENQDSQTYPSQDLPHINGNVTDVALCPVYPLIAVTSDIGEIVVFRWIEINVLCNYSVSVPTTCILWPNEKIDGIGASLLVGFQDGTLRWLIITKEDSSSGTEGNEKTERYNLILQAKVKPHNDAISCLSFNSSKSLLASQGLDTKLFIFHLEDFKIYPLGFYVNRHELDWFEWLSDPVFQNPDKEALNLVIFCKHSYLLVVDVSNILVRLNTSDTLETFYIENLSCQVYTIDGLLHCHELGDQISSSELLAWGGLSEKERNVLVKLKYKEKKEARETREKELGFTGLLKPPQILCSLPSTVSGRIWLSLDKNDSGYLFEFELEQEPNEYPINFTPVRAVEVPTAQYLPIISMCYSETGKYLLMGLRDGSLHMTQLEEEFDISTASNFKILFIESLDKVVIKDMKISRDGSIIRLVTDNGNKIVSNFNAYRIEEITDTVIIPAFKDKEMNVTKDWDGQDILSIEDKLQSYVYERNETIKEHVTSRLNELKENYEEFKKNYVVYIENCKKNLKRMEKIPEHLQLNYEIVSCCPTVVKEFEEETKALQRKLDKKYQKDLVKAELQKDKYFKFFKSKVCTGKISVEVGSAKIETFRQCTLPESALNISLNLHPALHGQNVHKKENIDETEFKSGKKNEFLFGLKQKLSSAMKDIIDCPIDTPLSHLISQYNKRKHDQIEKLQKQITEVAALENITIDETLYNETSEEVKSSLFKFKDNVGSEHILPDVICTFSEKKEKTLQYLKEINAFTENFNSHVTEAKKLKDLTEGESRSEKIKDEREQMFVPDKDLQDESESIFASDNDWQIKRPTQTILWDAYPEKQTIFYKAERKSAGDSKEWLKKKFKNLFLLLKAVKPIVNCEKAFNDIRFLIKCIELNAFKDTVSDEKLCLKNISELETILEAKNNELSIIMEEMNSLQNLRQHEKQKWTNLYHDLVKLVGQNHKYKGYFKQVFKKKILPKGEQKSLPCNTSSESSGCEQNIDSADDSSTVILSEIDEELLVKVMELRIERQSVEDAMKVLKTQINNCNTKENAVKRKIQNANDALEESTNKFQAILFSRKQSLEKIKWPVVLYPTNIHSDYINNLESDVQRQKKIMDSEMFRINEEIEKNLTIVNHYVNVSTFTLMSRVVNLEVNDLIDIAAVFLPLLEKVSSSIDKYFVNLRQVQSLEHLEEESEPIEPVNIIGEILATVDDPLVVPEDVESEIESQTNSSTSDDKDDDTRSKSTLIASEKSLKVISLSDFKVDESHQSSNRELISWSELVDDGNQYEPVDIQLPEQMNSEEILKSAIPEIDYSCSIVNDYSKETDYYMLPFTYTVTDNDLKKLKKRNSVSSSENELESSEVYVFQVDTSDQCDSLNKAIESDYPVYPGGGLKLTLPVLQGMEANDLDHFPYTDFLPKEEFEEELDYHHTVLDLKPQRSLVPESLFNYTTRPLSEFILVDKDDVQRTLTSYFNIKTSNEEIEMNLGSLKKEVMSTKRALNFKQHDVSKAKQELEMTMKTRFGQVLDLDQLQDALENPYFHIKKKEHQSQLDILKRKLKKMKETEAVAVKSLDQLRYEDTKLCYELYELRKELEFLNKCHSAKRKVLPKIG